MLIPFHKKESRNLAIMILSFAVLMVTVAYVGFFIWNLKTEKKALTDELNQMKTANAITLSRLENIRQENSALTGDLETEKTINNNFQGQIQAISSTVGLLDKLSKTDRELLQKYSNVYFLSENYIPSSLSDIDVLYLYRKDKTERIHTNIKPYLEKLLKDANDNSQSLLVLSAYRSFGTQASLKSSYKVVYGTTAANKFSADQGYSEHQLGSTIDFTTQKGGEVLEGFDKTSTSDWLTNNAHRYGFVLSYPKGNTYFQYEPWHFRFVGVELASKLHAENKHFYDLDQREINNYLVKIFD